NVYESGPGKRSKATICTLVLGSGGFRARVKQNLKWWGSIFYLRISSSKRRKTPPPREAPLSKFELSTTKQSSPETRFAMVSRLVAVLCVIGLNALRAQTALEAWVQRYNGPGHGHDYAQAVVVDGR